MKITLACSLLGLVALASAQPWTGDIFTLTPAAGALVAKQGTVQFNVAAATVAANQTLFVTPNPYVPQPAALLEGSAFTIGRPNLALAKPISTVFAINSAALPIGGTVAGTRVYRLENHRWKLLGGTVNAAASTVTVNISQPGTYALAASTVALLPAEDMIALQVLGAGDQRWFSVLPLTFNAPAWEISTQSQHRFIGTISTNCGAYLYTKPVNGRFDAYVANIDGSHGYRITNSQFLEYGGVTTSLDGKTLFFTAYDGTNWKLYRVNLDGTGLTTLVTLSTTRAAGTPSLNTAGTQLAVGDDNKIRIVNPTTGAAVRTLTVDPNASFIVGSVSFNYTATKLAYNGDGGLWSIGSTGAGKVQHVMGDVRGFAWSQDSTRICFYEVTGSSALVGTVLSTGAGSIRTWESADLGSVNMLWR